MTPVACTVMNSVAVLLLLAAPQDAPSGPGTSELTAPQVLERMSKVYASCKTYEDSGTAHQVIAHPNGRETVQDLAFHTSFARPRRFRFEYTQKKDGVLQQCIIWQQGDDVQNWSSFMKPKLRKAESFVDAIGVDMGVSLLTSFAIPSLLQPDDVPPQLPSIAKPVHPRRAADERINGVDCFRIEGTIMETKHTLWITKDTFLVVRLVRESKMKESFGDDVLTVTSKIDYRPVVDAVVADSRLAFDHPADK